MGYSAECYVLTNNRTREFIESFLDMFIPNRKERDGVYEIVAEENVKEFQSMECLINYLETNVDIVHTIIWTNLDSNEPHFASCLFTDDNNLIVGLGCNGNNRMEDELLNKLMNYCMSQDGYIAYEQPAPSNADEFKKVVRQVSI